MVGAAGFKSWSAPSPLLLASATGPLVCLPVGFPVIWMGRQRAFSPAANFAAQVRRQKPRLWRILELAAAGARSR